MKRYLLYLLFLLYPIFGWSQQKQKLYAVAFYNLENLFDTFRDPSINDEEFTPNGANAWTLDKYQKKLNNMSYAISRLGQDYTPDGVAFLGVAEVENQKVLEDLVKTGPLASVGYGIVHYDSPDYRGIDVALLYNPKLFKVTSSQVYHYVLPEEPDFKTRDQLLVNGILDGEPCHVIVNHWPSRRGGNQSSYLREHAAAMCKSIADSLYRVDPNSKVIIMGDLNDDPFNKSVKNVLGANGTQSKVKPGGFYNPFWVLLKRGIGSLFYQGNWNLFDQIILSQSFLRNNNGLKFWKAEVFNRDFLIQKEGAYKGYPLRTFSGNRFMNGYSDHFPTLVYLVKDRP